MQMVKWSKQSDPYNWDDWEAKSFWFPYGEAFLRKCPWLAKRVFFVIIKIKEFWSKIGG